ncbi:MAG: HAD family hydrolase [Fibrobacterales bacterium]
MSKKYQWILFDWNGTLLDDVEYGLGVVNTICKQYSVPEITHEWYLDNFGFPLFEFYEKLGFDFKEYSFDDLAQVFMSIYHAALDTVPLHTGTLEVLETLGQDYSLGIISAYKQERLDVAVKEYGVDSFFTAVYGVSDDRAHSKSHSLKEMLDRYQIDPQHTLLVGDTLHDFEVAQENGIDALLIEAGHQSMKQWHAILDETHLLKALHELPAWLRSQGD